MNYKASLKVSGRTFSAEGDTIFQAISNLETGNIKAPSVLTISNGEKKKERILPRRATMLTFNSHGLTRSVQVKNTSLLFQGI